MLKGKMTVYSKEWGKYGYNSVYAFSENQVTSHIELEGLEKVDFMVARFEPNLTTYKTQPKRNTNFSEVCEVYSKESLVFTVDLQTGEKVVTSARIKIKIYCQLVLML